MDYVKLNKTTQEIIELQNNLNLLGDVVENMPEKVYLRLSELKETITVKEAGSNPFSAPSFKTYDTYEGGLELHISDVTAMKISKLLLADLIEAKAKLQAEVDICCK